MWKVFWKYILQILDNIQSWIISKLIWKHGSRMKFQYLKFKWHSWAISNIYFKGTSIQYNIKLLDWRVPASAKTSNTSLFSQTKTFDNSLTLFKILLFLWKIVIFKFNNLQVINLLLFFSTWFFMLFKALFIVCFIFTVVTCKSFLFCFFPTSKRGAFKLSFQKCWLLFMTWFIVQFEVQCIYVNILNILCKLYTNFHFYFFTLLLR